MRDKDMETLVVATPKVKGRIECMYVCVGVCSVNTCTLCTHTHTYTHTHTQNSHRMSMESNSAASRKSSDAFSRELGTLSPLEFEVRGERFSSLDPVITAQQQQQLLLNYHHQHPSSIQEQHEQYTEEYRHHASPNRERTTNRGASSQSSGSPDEIFATEQKTEWEEDRRAGSAEPLTNLDGQV